MRRSQSSIEHHPPLLPSSPPVAAGRASRAAQDSPQLYRRPAWWRPVKAGDVTRDGPVRCQTRPASSSPPITSHHQPSGQAGHLSPPLPPAHLSSSDPERSPEPGTGNPLPVCWGGPGRPRQRENIWSEVSYLAGWLGEISQCETFLLLTPQPVPPPLTVQFYGNIPPGPPPSSGATVLICLSSRHSTLATAWPSLLTMMKYLNPCIIKPYQAHFYYTYNYTLTLHISLRSTFDTFDTA